MSIPNLKWPFIGWTIAKGLQICVEESFPPLRKSEKQALRNQLSYVPGNENLPSRYQGLFWQWRQWIRYQYEERLDWKTRAHIYACFGSNVHWTATLFIYDYELSAGLNDSLLERVAKVFYFSLFVCLGRCLLSGIRSMVIENSFPQPIKDIVLRAIRWGELPPINLEEKPEVQGEYQQKFPRISSEQINEISELFELLTIYENFGGN